MSLALVSSLACDGWIADPPLADDGGTTDTRRDEDDTEPPPPIDVGGPDDCSTPEAYFTSRLWPQVLEARCIRCHRSGGEAEEDAFALRTELEDDDFLATNFATVQRLAQEKLPSHDDRALLELKPTGTVMHGGGTAISSGGLLHRLILGFIQRVDGEPCDPDVEPPVDVPFFDGVTYASPARVLRKASLALAGRLPTTAEQDAVSAGGFEAVGTQLDAMMSEEGFVERVQEGFSDVLLTEGYTASTGELLAYENFPDRNWLYDEAYPYPVVSRDPSNIYRVGHDYNNALRREPRELVAYIVRGDRPITELLTANYAMVSPYTARGYGVFAELQDSFTDTNDPYEYIPTRLPPRRNRHGDVQESADGRYPHAGVLTTPQWLSRFQTTTTNRNRARTRTFYRQFFGVDLLALSQAVTDAADVTARFANPTMEAPDCVGCHRIMDPIAGLFQRYAAAGEFIVTPEEPWHTDMFPPGFESDEELPAEESWRSLQWLAERASGDPRFASTMAEHAFYILTQSPRIEPPIDEDDPLYARRLRASAARRDVINDAARELIANDFNIKAAFRSLVLSQLYRAEAYVGPEPDAGRSVELEAIGLWTLLTPEQLMRKFNAIFGFTMGSLDPFPYLTSSLASPTPENHYRLYGGIDRLEVTLRAATPNAAMGAVMRDVANQLSCELVPVALREGPGARVHELFPFVDENTTDEFAIRQNIASLHALILGRSASELEVSRLWRLFQEVRADGVAQIAAGSQRDRLNYACGSHPDPEYVGRAWQALFVYFVRHPEFLLQ